MAIGRRNRQVLNSTIQRGYVIPNMYVLIEHYPTQLSVEQMYLAILSLDVLAFVSLSKFPGYK